MPSRQLLMFVLFNSGPTLTFNCVHEQRAKKFRQSVQMSWWLEWAQCNLPGPSGVEGDVKVQLGPETSRRLFFSPPSPPVELTVCHFCSMERNHRVLKKKKKKKNSRLGGWDKKQEEEGKEREVLRHKILPGWCGGGLMQAWQGDILKDAWKDKLISQIKNGNQDV